VCFPPMKTAVRVHLKASNHYVRYILYTRMCSASPILRYNLESAISFACGVAAAYLSKTMSWEGMPNAEAKAPRQDH
jgi:hypothetical protein